MNKYYYDKSNTELVLTMVELDKMTLDQLMERNNRLQAKKEILLEQKKDIEKMTVKELAQSNWIQNIKYQFNELIQESKWGKLVLMLFLIAVQDSAGGGLDTLLKIHNVGQQKELLHNVGSLSELRALMKSIKGMLASIGTGILSATNAIIGLSPSVKAALAISSATAGFFYNEKNIL